VGRLKRALSGEESATLAFENENLTLHAQVTRAEFESWIAPDLERIAQTVDVALARAGVAAHEVDHVFLTGGSSLIPAVRRLFVERFGEGRIESGEELTSIAHGLALIGEEPDMEEWTAGGDGAEGEGDTA
jgi:hypothetical chaperone protein